MTAGDLIGQVMLRLFHFEFVLRLHQELHHVHGYVLRILLSYHVGMATVAIATLFTCSVHVPCRSVSDVTM